MQAWVPTGYPDQIPRIGVRYAARPTHPSTPPLSPPRTHPPLVFLSPAVVLCLFHAVAHDMLPWICLARAVTQASPLCARPLLEPVVSAAAVCLSCARASRHWLLPCLPFCSRFRSWTFIQTASSPACLIGCLVSCLGRCPQLSCRQVLFLTKHLADTAKQELGQSMLHILVTAMNDMLEELPSDPPFPAIRPPPAPRQILPQATPASQAAAAGAMPSSDASPANRRTARQWTPSAQEQQQESMQLRRQQEALCSDPKHAKMQAARQKLPAFSRRQELLAQLRQHSVTVISGATGVIWCHTASPQPRVALHLPKVDSTEVAGANCCCRSPI